MSKNKTMTTARVNLGYWEYLAFTGALCLLLAVFLVQVKAQTTTAAGPRTFATPQLAVDALIAAAGKYDEAALKDILGPDSWDIVHTGEPARDREIVTGFAEQAQLKNSISLQPRNPRRAFLAVGEDEWPFPLPLVKGPGGWAFDAKEGRQEILFRRIGRNELDAIQIMRGFVEAQHDYALLKHDSSGVNQYAQKIISTPGKQDGLAWQNADGTWGGPIGEKAAQALAKGHRQGEPYHGYFFKVLKGQGPLAPLGELDFVIKDVMIGGFALIAAPAQYRNTGVKTFLVSHDGVVYEKDLGPKTLELFEAIDRFNPDKSWTPVMDDN
jgi:hypothetical protein